MFEYPGRCLSCTRPPSGQRSGAAKGSPFTGIARRIEDGVRHDTRRSHRDRGWGRIFPAPGHGRTPSEIDRPTGSSVAATHRHEASSGLSPVVGACRSPPGIRASGGGIACLVLALRFNEQGCVHDRRLAASPGVTARALDARKRATPRQRPVSASLAFGSWTLLHPSCSQRSRAVEAFVPTNVGTRTSHRGFRHRGRESGDPPDQIRGFLTDHDRRRVRVCAHQRRHDRSIHHTQAFRSPYAQLGIDDGERVVPHATRSDRVVHGVGPLAQQRTNVVVRSRAGREQVLRHEPGHGRRRHQPPGQLVSVDQNLEIIVVLEECRVDQRYIERIGASQLDRPTAFRPQQAHVTGKTVSELHLPAVIADGPTTKCI